MSEKENDIRSYGAADLERYHSGKMTELEMHALEKAALDDPFLADALDGYRHTATAKADIEELKNKLIHKKDDKKIVWIRRRSTALILRIAAILILISGAGLILYKNKSSKKNEIALVLDKKKLPGNSKNSFYDTTTIKQKEDIAPVETKTKRKSNITSEKKIQAQEITTVNRKDNFTIDQANNDSIADSARQITQHDSYATQTDSERDVSKALAGKVAGIQVRPQSANTNIIIRGRVTDDKGAPVSFATVTDNKNKIGVQSNSQGTFVFASKDSSPEVSVNAVGYKKVIKELNHDSAKNNLVMLERDENTIKEVIVTSAFGTKRKSMESSSIAVSSANIKLQRVSVTNAIPVNGWQNFNKYINDSLRTLQQLGPYSVSAEVSVSFAVDGKGLPVAINVKRSLCSSCDEEAIRIIKNSPPWKLNKKRRKANAIVRF